MSDAPRSSGWGQAWIDALEQRAGIDPARLARGRAGGGLDRVVRLELERGRITALVRGSKALPYRVSVTARVATEAQWDRVAAAVAGRTAHAAALLDGELDPAISADADAAGVPLLPGLDDLSMRCSCPDGTDPCPHAAAVCYVVADRIDADPFALLQLRGIERDAFVARVRAHRTGADEQDPTGAAGTAPGTGAGRQIAAAFGGGPVVDPGMVAREAWARPVPPPPERRPLPAGPGDPPRWPADPPRDAPFTTAGLTELAADAARRAFAQLGDGAPSHLDLDEPTDLARRAADHLARYDALLALARRAGVPTGQLVHQAQAWQSAGAEGIAALEEARWAPPRAVLQQGLDALAEAGVDETEVQVRSNRLTIDDLQLRVSQDLRWWRYERRGRAWELVEPPVADPRALVDP